MFSNEEERKHREKSNNSTRRNVCWKDYLIMIIHRCFSRINLDQHHYLILKSDYSVRKMTMKVKKMP